MWSLSRFLRPHNKCTTCFHLLCLDELFPMPLEGPENSQVNNNIRNIESFIENCSFQFPMKCLNKFVLGKL